MLHILRSWKTTAAGVALLVGTAADVRFRIHQNIPVDWRWVHASTLMALGLIVGKDADQP